MAGKPKWKMDKPDEQALPITTLLRKRLNAGVVCSRTGETKPVSEILVDRLVEHVNNGDRWALQFVVERIEGKAVERINVGGDVPASLGELIAKGMMAKGEVIDLTPEEKESKLSNQKQRPEA